MRISFYTLPHGEPEFSLTKTLNESDINIVAALSRSTLSKATYVIPISFEAKSYKCPVFYYFQWCFGSRFGILEIAFVP